MAHFEKTLASQMSFEDKGRTCWPPKQIRMTSLIFFPGSQHENSSIATECTKCYQTKGAAQIARELMPAGKGHLRDGNGEASLGPDALQDHSHRRPCCPPSVMSIGVCAV
jgi:hypothetical protein